MFLPYLEDWEKWVKSIPDLTTTERNNMLLSSETRLGLKITCEEYNSVSLVLAGGCVRVNYYYFCHRCLSFAGKWFIELVHYLFKIPDVQSFLSQRICQDPLENFFGCQRQRGGVHDPNVEEFTKNTQALRVINSFCKGPARGNCRGGSKRSST